MKLNLRVIVLFFLFIGVENSFAQTHTLKGHVVNKEMQPLSGAFVQFPDIDRMVTCDDSGNFVMRNIPGSSQVISIMRVGYHTLVTRIELNDTLVEMTFQLENGNRETEEVIIIGTQTHGKNTSTTVATLSQRGMRSNGALSISDGVAKLPGVSQLTTGAGISKPVIRGLYGNRIQTVMMGMRFDNQQWQDEHGLGLNDIGVDRVEVIKGPASLMYGSEAMGGVINLIEEKPADVDSLRADVSTRFFSNTFGAAVDGGVRATKAHHFYRVRIGMESQADYSDGNNKRILNSRFDGYVGKATFGFDHRNWVSVNNYMFSRSDFGFIMDTSAFMKVDDRLSRGLENPHHTVYINMFTTQNSFFIGHGNVIRANGGMHINRRMEDEGGSGISLDMQLITATMNVQLEHQYNDNLRSVFGMQSQFQDNTNFGARVIVPDARMTEASFYMYHAYTNEKLNLELGLRYDLKAITTFALPQQQVAPPVYLDSVHNIYNTFNGSAGFCRELAKDLFLRSNITTGYRTPNLAELESNGVHEGTLHYEIGNPGMKIEQNFSAEGGLSYEAKRFSVSGTAYDYRFLNYIYLTPSSDYFYGFRIYRFIQTNATIQGTEATIDVNPLKTDLLDISASWSMVRAITDQGNYLPFIPADKLSGEVKLNLDDKGKFNDMYVRAGAVYCFAQNNPAQFETSTPSYYLIDAGLGTTVKLNRGKIMNIDLVGNNLLNEKYFDHLSRFKEYNIYNI
ncbi:MAG TPA: TonB-dependent receptor, partial [Bacteroidia bacterium]|nr:TonB-dependent receptor [Bacteroidia bacterium]